MVLKFVFPKFQFIGMFGLKVPVCQSLGSPDFDDVNTILSNSSFSKKDNPWQDKVDDKGNIFYLEVVEKCKHLKLKNCNENSIDDVGYGTDNEFNNFQLNISEFIPPYKNSSSKEECLVANCKCSQNGNSPDFYRMDNLVQFKIPVKHVNLGKLIDGTPRPHTYIGRLLCKELLGIIPGHFKSSKSSSTNGNQRLCIRGLDPTKDILKRKHVHIGDCLRLVNGQEVTWSNVDEVFTKLCSVTEVTVVVQQLSKKSTKTSSHHGITYTIAKDSGIVQLLPKQDQITLRSIDDNSFCAMYVNLEKLNSEQNQKDDDLVYRFPDNDSEIFRMRGAFVTIYSTLSEFSISSANRTTFTYKNKAMNATYHKEDGNLLIVLYQNDRVHPLLVPTLLQNLVRVLQVQYNSLHEAFSHQDNHPSLTALLSSIHHQISSAHFSTDAHQSRTSQNSVQYLPLDSVFMDGVDGLLTGWEALDCKEMSDSYYGCRRTFTVLGSSLFYKDHVVCNHLPKDDLLDAYLYLKYQMILSVCCSETVQTTVIWREIYPTRQFYNLPEEEPFGYTEPVSARWFWLIVSYKHTVLCTMLETSGYHMRSGISLDPDPFLIDQAKATLMQIINLNMHQQIEHCYRQNTASLVTTLQDCSHKSSSSSNDILKNNLFNRHRKSGRFLRDSSVRSNASTDSGSSVDSGIKKPALYYHTAEGGYMLDLNHGLDIPRTDIKLSVGSENCMLHYLHVDKYQGVYIKSEVDSGDTDQNVLFNFSLSCSKIKNIFDRYRYKRKSQEPGTDSSKMLPGGQDPTFRNIREEGVLFHILSNPVEKSHTAYWVVGRQRSLTETYVCFKDGIPQSTVELAFKLAFGMKPG